jgi:hypothetical protein
MINREENRCTPLDGQRLTPLWRLDGRIGIGDIDLPLIEEFNRAVMFGSRSVLVKVGVQCRGDSQTLDE